MTRQIEINFFTHNVDNDDQPIASDLFGVPQENSPSSMHLDNSMNNIMKASITVDAFDDEDSLFKND